MKRTNDYPFPNVEKPVARDRLCELLDFVTEAFDDPCLGNTPGEAEYYQNLARDHIEALKELILLRDVCGTAFDAAG